MNEIEIHKFIEFICYLQGLEYTPSIEIDESLPILATYNIEDYNFKNAKIIINSNISVNKLLLYLAVAHELRHACQFEAMFCENGYEILPLKLIEAMRKNLDNYIQSDDPGYKQQILELDAFGFAEFIMNKVFNIKITYNNTFTKDEINSIYKYAEELNKEYYDDEIKDSLLYSGFDPKILN